MGTKERKEREKMIRRTAIINAAERVFFLHGIEEATMDQVAQEVELSKGTLYLYFKSKDELYRAILQRGYQILKKDILKAISRQNNGFENIMAGIKSYINFSFTHPGYFSALLYYENDTFDLEEMEPESEQCLNAGKELLHLLAHSLENGIKDDSIGPHISPLQDALVIWAQITGLLQMIRKRNSIMKKMYGVEKEKLILSCQQLLECSLKNC